MRISLRYSGIGADIESRKARFEELEAYMPKKGDSERNASDWQEMLEKVINRFFRKAENTGKPFKN